MNQNLIANQFFKDTQVTQAKEEIIAALKEYQQKLTEIKPAQAELVQSYEATLRLFEEVRGSKPIFPYVSSGLGNGALVELADGSVKYDFIIGIGVFYFGHSHPELTERVLTAALSDTVMQGNLIFEMFF